MVVKGKRIATQEERLAELDRIIAERDVTPVFQPIVDLHSGEPLGYEALSRGPSESPLASAAMLFDTATKAGSGKLWDLELACRERILEVVPEGGPGGFLFMNVDPFVLLDSRFGAGMTPDRLEERKLHPEKIVFEITERRAISDFERFRAAAEHYHRQGFQIAIDDAGAGYSGLYTLVRTRPQFVKIDQELIRNLHVHGMKQNLVRFFVSFARSSGFRLIAEGIETAEELQAVMRLGIHYGQGYYIARPKPELKPPTDEVQEELRAISRANARMTMRSVKTVPVGQLAHPAQWVEQDTRAEEVEAMFHEHPEMRSLVVRRNGDPTGLLMRTRFNYMIWKRMGGEDWKDLPVGDLMQPSPLTVAHDTPIETVNRRAMARPVHQVYDDIIVEADGAPMGMVTVRDLLEATTDLELESARYASPLTNLPGNVVIEREINRAIEEEEHWAVILIDMNNFKVFNDVYGFQMGDEIIRATSEMVQSEFGPPKFDDAFVGHTGAGDFVVVVPTRRVDEACRHLARRFDREVLSFYGEDDRTRGFLEVTTRAGKVRRFPLLSLSVSVIDNDGRAFSEHREIERMGVGLRREAKRRAVTSRCSVLLRETRRFVDEPDERADATYDSESSELGVFFSDPGFDVSSMSSNSLSIDDIAASSLDES